MKLSKIVATTLMTLSLTTSSLMAGSKTSEHMIAQAKKGVKGITPQELHKMFEEEKVDVWMLDIREPYMIPEGSIDGIENIEVPRGLLEMNVESKIKDKNAFIVVYCRSGKGAVLAAKTVEQDLHYKNVRYLEGGINGWLEAGYTIYNSFGGMQLAE